MIFNNIFGKKKNGTCRTYAVHGSCSANICYPLAHVCRTCTWGLHISCKYEQNNYIYAVCVVCNCLIVRLSHYLKGNCCYPIHWIETPMGRGQLGKGEGWAKGVGVRVPTPFFLFNCFNFTFYFN